MMLSKILESVSVKLSIAVWKLIFVETRFQISSVQKLIKNLMLKARWNPANKKPCNYSLKKSSKRRKSKSSKLKNSKLSVLRMNEDKLNFKPLKNAIVKSKFKLRRIANVKSNRLPSN
jgi:hypothetical protein